MGTDEDVLGLQVAVYDISGMQVLNGQDQLANEEFSDVLLEPGFGLLGENQGQVPARAVIENHVEELRCLGLEKTNTD